MSDCEDLNLTTKQKVRKKKSPINLKLHRTRREAQLFKRKTHSGTESPTFTCASDIEGNIILTGRKDTRFIMSTASANFAPPQTELPVYVQSGSTPTSTTLSGMPQSKILEHFDYESGRERNDIDNRISQAVTAAELKMQIKHHEEMDELRKQLEALKVRITANNTSTQSNPGASKATGARPKTSRQPTIDSYDLQINPNANLFVTQQRTHHPSNTQSSFIPQNPPPQFHFPNMNIPPPFHDNPRQSLGSMPHPLNESFGNSFSKIVPIHKWKVKYNGDGSVSQFLFKVNSLRKKNLYDEEEVFNNFDMLLEGRAETFYWRFISVNPNARYTAFVRAFSTEFGSGEKDCMVMANLAQKRQGINESFTDFLESMRSLLDRMEQPIPDTSFISLVKANCKPELSNLLYALPIYSKEALSRAGKDAEQQLYYQNKLYRPPYAKYENRRMISEVKEDNTKDQLARIAELEAKIEAIKFQNMKKTSKVEEEIIKGCFNCRAKDHFQKDCPHEVTETYCFRCGKRDTITPKCQRCNPKNQKEDDVISGTHRQI